MTLKDKIKSGVQNPPPKILVYGTSGIGKTTFASTFPVPLFFQTEEGAEQLGVDRLPLPDNADDFLNNLRAFLTEEHAYKTLVIDSMDWLANVINTTLCARNGWKDISEPAYGKGYGELFSEWMKILNALNIIQKRRNVGLVLIAHADIRRFDDPSSGSYDRYMPDLHKNICSSTIEFCDGVFFMNRRISVTREKVGFNEINKAQGRGQRVLYTEERPGFIAKNRYGMPAEVELSDARSGFNLLKSIIPYYNNAVERKGKDNG